MTYPYLRPCAGGCGRMVTSKRCRACYRAEAVKPLPVVLQPVGAGPWRIWIPKEQSA